ncbi:MAG: flagellar assembly protein FliW [Candidatus Eisenbacteria bacterium]
MKVASRLLGPIDISEDERIRFPGGLLGFEGLEDFALVALEEYAPFLWLLSEDDADVAFALGDPEPFLSEPYPLVLDDADAAVLDLEPGDRVQVLLFVQTTDEPCRVTANLKAPVVVNLRSRRAKQLILYGSRLSSRQPARALAGTGRNVRAHEITVQIPREEAA